MKRIRIDDEWHEYGSSRPKSKKDRSRRPLMTTILPIRCSPPSWKKSAPQPQPNAPVGRNWKNTSRPEPHQRDRASASEPRKEKTVGRWGHDSDDDTDGKPIRHLVRANQARQRTRLAPKPAKKEETKPRSYEKPSARTLMDGIRQLVLDDPEIET